MRAPRRSARSVAALLVLAGCKVRSTAGQGNADGAVEGAAVDPVSSAGPRCVPAQRAPSLGVEGDVEFGGVARYAGGIAVGLTRPGAHGTEAAVALLPADATATRVVALGPSVPDAPPPVITGHGAAAEDLLAIAPTTTRAGGRAMQLYRVAGDGSVESKAVVVDVRDDWPSVDVGASGNAAIVAWDGLSSDASRRSVIRVAALDAPPSLRTGPPRDVSPPGEDAEDPRVLRSGAGFVVIWAATRPEASALDAGRAGRWLEAAVIDERGQSPVAITRLTPESAMVSSFDVGTIERAPGAASTIVVARYEGSQGAALRLLRVFADGPGEHDVAAAEGMGPGAPSLLAGPQPWVSWMGAREQVVLLPVDEGGNPAGPATDEEAFDGAQPLLTLGATEILAASPATATKRAALGVYSCRR